ncbi:MAG: hypothetical protein FWF10_08060 [Clostridiales bacterium]|nr:hypothetical protein [Clostridiales bacterium]
MWNWDPQTDTNVQKAVQEYISEKGYTLPEDTIFEAAIDAAAVVVADTVVLWVGLPPMSNYRVRETEHAKALLSA